MRYEITLMDTDGKRLRDCAQRLRRALNQADVKAKVTEVSCFLEISRQGYSQKLPAMLMDGRCMWAGAPLKDAHLYEFCAWLQSLSEQEAAEKPPGPAS